MWGLAVLAYAVAVFNRSSLGVTGLAAQHRFHVGPTVFSLFSVLQLAVYAGMQVPVGVLLDRFGSRRMIGLGALVMALGQFTLASAHSVGLAILARVLVGGGDAMTFISVLRLAVLWFPPRQIPLVTQLTGILGQLGQVAAAYPLVALLRHAGWHSTFLGVAGLGTLIAILVGVALADAPPGARTLAPPPLAQVRRNLAAAWRRTGTRLGLWTHFTTQFSGTVFALLWGYPFLVTGEQLSPAAASALLTVLVAIGMVAAPLLGALVGGWPLRRSALVLAEVTATVAVWTAVLAWPGRAPLGLLVLLVLVLGTNGPTSMIGFDYARTSNPAGQLGSASGMVNVGGFVASLLTILAIGLVLGALTRGGGAHYSLGAFRAAFAVQYLLWAFGLGQILRHRRALRREHRSERPLPDPLHRAAVRRLRG